MRLSLPGVEKTSLADCHPTGKKKSARRKSVKHKSRYERCSVKLSARKENTLSIKNAKLDFQLNSKSAGHSKADQRPTKQDLLAGLIRPENTACFEEFVLRKIPCNQCLHWNRITVRGFPSLRDAARSPAITVCAGGDFREILPMKRCRCRFVPVRFYISQEEVADQHQGLHSYQASCH